MIHPDGGGYSGSGTIVRFGVALAALAGQELEITNIRAKRDQPGLRPQHLTAVKAVAKLVQGSLEGGAVGSRRLCFRPGPLPAGGSYHWDIGTAGSTTMLALAILPVAAFAAGPCTFRLSGGLFQNFAPSAFHFQHALLPLLRRLGLKADLRLLRPGYVPTGGGSILLEVEPVTGNLKPLRLIDPGSDLRLWGISLASRLGERKVAHRMATSCQVSNYMSSPVITAQPGMDILDAAHLMAEQKVKRVPVVEGNQLIVLVSFSDVAQAMPSPMHDLMVGMGAARRIA